MSPDSTQAACLVCGSERPRCVQPVLWPALISEWGLSAEEAAAMDRREGGQCPDCHVALRSAALASALTRHVGWSGTFDAWASSAPSVSLLEVNRAGQLTPWLQRLPGHHLVEFPDIDLHALVDDDGSWDLVVHSETLEHVDDPERALRECRRVLRPRGALICTVPVVSGRLTRRRDGLPPSFHGLEHDPAYRVVTEYGADFWTQLCDAGFAVVSVVTSGWPDTMAIVAEK